MVKLSDLRKKERLEQDNWQLTFADMMTLLLCFYVLILSVSRLDPAKYEKVAGSLEQAMTRKRPEVRPEIRKAPAPARMKAPERDRSTVAAKINKKPIGPKAKPAAPTAPAAAAPAAPAASGKKNLAELRRELAAKFAGRKGEIELKTGKNAVAVSLRGAAFFDLASAELSPDSLHLLDDIAASLAGTSYKVTVEGHTDNLPIDSWVYPSNWELSAARAGSVARRLIQGGVPKDKTTIAGLADTRPVAPNIDAEGRSIPENQAKNRRVVILVSP